MPLENGGGATANSSTLLFDEVLEGGGGVTVKCDVAFDELFPETGAASSPAKIGTSQKKPPSIIINCLGTVTFLQINCV